MKEKKEQLTPAMESETIFTDKHRIAALERGNRAHIDWTSNHQNIDQELKRGDEIWVYGDTHPHRGSLCAIEKVDTMRRKKYGDLLKMTVSALD